MGSIDDAFAYLYRFEPSLPSACCPMTGMSAALSRPKAVRAFMAEYVGFSQAVRTLT